jgi:hypothetical protein
LSAALPVPAAPSATDTDKSAVRSFFIGLDEVLLSSCRYMDYR